MKIGAGIAAVTDLPPGDITLSDKARKTVTHLLGEIEAARKALEPLPYPSSRQPEG